MKRMILSIVAIAVLLGVAPAAEAAWRDYFNWEVYVWMDDGQEKGKLRIGTSELATDGYDSKFESDAFPAGYVRPYFYHPEWNRSSQPGGTNYFYSDIRSSALPQTWIMSVQAYRTGRDVTLSWDLKHLESAACKDISIALTDDANGQTVIITEMDADEHGNKFQVNPSYSYYNASNAVHTFTVVASEIDAAVGDAPANLDVKSERGPVVLQWDADSSIDGYRIYRDGNVVSGEALLTDDDADGKITYVDKGVLQKIKADRRSATTRSTSYEYSVVSVSSEGCEGEASTVGVTR